MEEVAVRLNAMQKNLYYVRLRGDEVSENVLVMVDLGNDAAGTVDRGGMPQEGGLGRSPLKVAHGHAVQRHRSVLSQKRSFSYWRKMTNVLRRSSGWPRQGIAEQAAEHALRRTSVSIPLPGNGCVCVCVAAAREHDVLGHGHGFQQRRCAHAEVPPERHRGSARAPGAGILEDIILGDRRVPGFIRQQLIFLLESSSPRILE
mmetsp:Transcript_23694/g.52540  ORF Transcript_23694/g.52540 Transcript_23694/m.52540 type:complete len:203 (+) Transcript_23694:343-951(+)